MADKKLRLLYLLQFLQQETDEEHPAALADILAYLERCGISAERKTIYDDLALLDAFGLDVQKTRGKHYGYYLAQRDFQLAEVKTLIDAVQACPFLTARKSMALIGKLEKLTSHPAAARLRRQVYVLGRVHTSNETLYYTVDGLHTAISDNRQVAFRYFDWTVDGQKQYRRKGQLYTVNPVALCVDRDYYLVTYEESRQEYRNYRVDRMEGLRVLDAPRAPLPADFDLGRYVKTSFSMYKGDTVTVTLRFALPLVNAVTDRFGPDAHRRKTDDGYFELTAPVELSPTFYGWLFQFGNEAQLLSPASARAEFADWCRNVTAQYED